MKLASIRPLAFLRAVVYVSQVRLAKTERGQPKHVRQPAHQLVQLDCGEAHLLPQYNYGSFDIATLCSANFALQCVAVRCGNLPIWHRIDEFSRMPYDYYWPGWPG